MPPFLLRLCCLLLCPVVPPLLAQTDPAPIFAPCHLTGSGGSGSLQAQCATWLRPLNPDAGDGEQIELFIAKLPSTAMEPAADALTLINGGPGGSSVDLLVEYAPVLQRFTRERDVLVIDQRGTGRSTALNCASLTDAPEAYEEAKILEATAGCLQQLSHDPRFFTTSVAVTDLEALRVSLGYAQLSLYGVSYGTRVVQQYLRRYPEFTRSAVIDGVVPPPAALGSNVALNSQQALDNVFSRCHQAPACAENFPTLEADFDRLSTRLKAQSVALTLPHPVSGIATNLDFTYGHLALWIRLALYVPETSALIPMVIDQAANRENYLPVAASALRMLDALTRSINYGMHNAVVCTEDAPFYSDDDADREAAAATYLGREMADSLRAMCSLWPAGVRHDDLKAPLESDVPVLVLSGEFDPITPPAYGEAVMPGLQNATHIIAPGQGHGVLARGCVPTLVLEFVEAASSTELASDCVKYLSPFPFFTNAMGPPP